MLHLMLETLWCLWRCVTLQPSASWKGTCLWGLLLARQGLWECLYSLQHSEGTPVPHGLSLGVELLLQVKAGHAGPKQQHSWDWLFSWALFGGMLGGGERKKDEACVLL